MSLTPNVSSYKITLSQKILKLSLSRDLRCFLSSDQIILVCTSERHFGLVRVKIEAENVTHWRNNIDPFWLINMVKKKAFL